MTFRRFTLMVTVHAGPRGEGSSTVVNPPPHLKFPSEEDGVAAWTAGRRAAMTYQPRRTCPYTPDDPHYQVLKGLWEKGWREGALLQARLHGHYSGQ